MAIILFQVFLKAFVIRRFYGLESRYWKILAAINL